MILSPVLIGGRCLIIPLPKRKQRMERQKEKRKKKKPPETSHFRSFKWNSLFSFRRVKKFIEYLFSSLTGSKWIAIGQSDIGVSADCPIFDRFTYYDSDRFILLSITSISNWF